MKEDYLVEDSDKYVNTSAEMDYLIPEGVLEINPYSANYDKFIDEHVATFKSDYFRRRLFKKRFELEAKVLKYLKVEPANTYTLEVLIEEEENRSTNLAAIIDSLKTREIIYYYEGGEPRWGHWGLTSKREEAGYDRDLH